MGKPKEKLDLVKGTKSKSGRPLKKNPNYYTTTSEDESRETNEKQIYDGALLLSEKEDEDSNPSDDGASSSGNYESDANNDAQFSNSDDESILDDHAEELSTCCVCNREIRSSHTCSKCKKQCHPFCGRPTLDENGEPIEGHGAELICRNCDPKKNIKKSDSRKRLSSNSDKVSNKKRKTSSVKLSQSGRTKGSNEALTPKHPNLGASSTAGCTNGTNKSPIPKYPNKGSSSTAGCSNGTKKPVIPKNPSEGARSALESNSETNKTAIPKPLNQSARSTTEKSLSHLESILKMPQFSELLHNVETYAKLKIDEMLGQVQEKLVTLSSGARNVISVFDVPEGFPLKDMEDFNKFENDEKLQESLRMHFLAWNYKNVEDACAEYLKIAIEDKLLFEKFDWIKKVDEVIILHGTKLEKVIHSSIQTNLQGAVDSKKYKDAMKKAVKNAKQRHRDKLLKAKSKENNDA